MLFAHLRICVFVVLILYTKADPVFLIIMEAVRQFPMNTLASSRDWFYFLVAIGPMAIAVFVAGVAFQQWQTNRHKLKLDLYNRRFEVYTNTISFFQALMDLNNGEPEESFTKVHRSFIRSYKESQFLFGKKSKVYELLEELHLESFKVIGLKRHSKDLFESGSLETFGKMTLEANKVFSRFDETIQKLETAMAPYLNFHKVAG